MDSILTSVKKALGIEESYEHFDPDIILHTNSVMMSLNQFGVGPKIGFMITGKDEKWVDLLGERKDLEAVKTYIYLKVKLIFDPPTVAAVLESMNRQITECEWRITAQVENNTVEGGT